MSEPPPDPAVTHPASASSLARLPVRRFDLAATLGSGQAFHWMTAGDASVGLINRTPVRIRQPAPDFLEVTEGTESAVHRYFALDHDLDAIEATFPVGDLALSAAVRFAPGLRLIRQPAWECLATFITSSLKQVPHISAISHTLRRKFGDRVDLGPHTLHTYPSPEALARAGESALRGCGLGYRAAYLAATAKRGADGTLDLGFLNAPEVPDHEAKTRLMTAPGVGPKVAACVLLFAGERLGFFPIDVWIERTLRERYFPRRRTFSPGFLERFVDRHFGPYRGYAQQFLFHHARTAPR